MKDFLLGFCFLLSTAASPAQNPLQKVLKNYFRTHPFDRTFSSFITSLQQDSWFRIDVYNRRTDSSFFYLAGHYINFNPFQYPAREVKLIIAESEYKHNDSLETLDTIINLQMLGITDTSRKAAQYVEKEFRRFHKIYAPLFWQTTYDYAQKKGQRSAELYNYFIYPFSISPVTIAWGLLPETEQYTFTLTLRCKVRENIADLILAPGGL